MDKLAKAISQARKAGCICPAFSDTDGYRIADLTCPVHGLDGPSPGDGPWVDEQ